MNRKYRELSKEEKKAYHKAYYEEHKEAMKKQSINQMERRKIK